jgi:hypothetical protein
MKFKTLVVLFIVIFSLNATGQFRGRGRGQQPQLPPPLGTECAPDDRICLERKAAREKAQNKERQDKLKADTAKLYQLATELKNAVDKTNENVLSVEVIRKTDEIEKLAKEIRKKMKNE